MRTLSAVASNEPTTGPRRFAPGNVRSMSATPVIRLRAAALLTKGARLNAPSRTRPCTRRSGPRRPAVTWPDASPAADCVLKSKATACSGPRAVTRKDGWRSMPRSAGTSRAISGMTSLSDVASISRAGSDR